MKPILFFILMRILDDHQVFGNLESDQNRLDQFIDFIEDNENKIHRGIASGRYEKEDKKVVNDEVDDDDYGKLLFDDMVNFRKVKIPGVDYEMEPISVPIEIRETEPIEEDQEEEEEDTPPPPPLNEAEDPNPINVNVEAVADQSVPYIQSQDSQPLKEAINAKNYENRGSHSPNSVQDSLTHSIQSIPIDNSDANHETHQQTQASNPETESPLPINSYHETLKYNENLSPNQNTYEEFSSERPQPLPPISHSSYQDSADSQNTYRNDDNRAQNPGVLTDVNNQNERSDDHINNPQTLNEYNYPNTPQDEILYNPNVDPNQIQQTPQYQQNSEQLSHQYPNSDQNQRQSDNYQNTDVKHTQQISDHYPNSNSNPNQQQSDNYPNSDPNSDPNYTQQQPEYYPNSDPNSNQQQPDYYPNSDPNLNQQPLDYYPNSDSNPNQQQSDYYSKNDSNPDQKQSDYYQNSDPNHAQQYSQYYPKSDPNLNQQQSDYYTNSDSNPDQKPSDYYLNDDSKQSQQQYEQEQNVNPNQNTYDSTKEQIPTQFQYNQNPSQTQYLNENAVTSEIPTELASTQHYTEVNPEVNEDKNQFHDYKNTNEAQIIDENKQISKRIGLSSNDDSENSAVYYPRGHEPQPRRNSNKPTIGSRVYSKTQEYTSYIPNQSSKPDEGDFSQDEPKSYYDRWAEEHMKLSDEEKYKPVEDDNSQNRDHNHEEPNSESDISRIRNPNDYPESNQNNYMPNSYNEQQDQTPQHNSEPIRDRYNPSSRSGEAQSPQTDDNEQQYNPFEQKYIENSDPFSQNSENQNNENQNSNQQTEKPNEEFQYDFPKKESFNKKVTSGQFGTFSQMPYNFESLMQSDTSFLDALTPQNLSGLVNSNQDYDNNNQEITSQNPYHFQGNDQSNSQSSSPPTDMVYEQQNYEPQRNAHHSHQPHSHQSNREQHFANDEHSEPNHYSQQNPRLYSDQLSHDQQHNNGYYSDQNNDRPTKKYQRQQQYSYENQMHPSSRSRNQYYDEVTAAAVSLPKILPKNKALYSDESRKVLTQSNTTINDNIYNSFNKTSTLNPIRLPKPIITPFILRSKTIVIEDKDNTKHKSFVIRPTVSVKIQDKKLKINIPKKITIKSIQLVNKNTVRNATQIPIKLFSTKKRRILGNNSKNNAINYKNNSTNHLSESHANLNASQPLYSSQHSVRTVRTRPQRSIHSILMNFGDKGINSLQKSKLNLLFQNSQNVPKAASQRNQEFMTNNRRSLENNITLYQSQPSNPKCAEKSSIENFCYDFDQDYPHELIRKYLLRNIEKLRSTYGKMNSTEVSSDKDENSADLLTNSCPAHQIDIYPLRAKNMKGEWKLIVNVENLFNQKVAITNCRQVQNECKFIPRLFHSECVQKLSSHYFMVYNMETSEIEIEKFRIPTACSCYIINRRNN